MGRLTIFLSINFDLLPRARVTRIGIVSLDALAAIFLHTLSIVIQDVCGPLHAICFREKIVMAELSEHAEGRGYQYFSCLTHLFPIHPFSTP